jgi:hypothetical protein
MVPARLDVPTRHVSALKARLGEGSKRLFGREATAEARPSVAHNGIRCIGTPKTLSGLPPTHLGRGSALRRFSR